MSTVSAAPERAGENLPASSGPAGSRTPRTDLILGAGLAVALVALAFLTSSSVDQTVNASGTWTQIVVTLLGAGACAAAVLLGARGRPWGATSVALFAAFTGFAALSILWSVQPDWSWFGANQLLAYLTIFAGAVGLARTFPERWPALLGGVGTAMVALSAYSLLAKVFPATLAPNNVYGRLLAPFGYWNTIGVAAALGLPACLWAGARRGGSRLLRALSVPAMSLLISVIELSYSRSAALAAVLGVGFWVAFVPLRLRTMFMLALGALGAAPIIAWALTHAALTSDGTPLAAQGSAGHAFGWVLLIVVLIGSAVGAGAALAAERVAVSPLIRRRVGAGLLGLLAMAPVLVVVALAASSRGLTGEISHAWTTLTSSHSTVGDTSSRITQLGSSRPFYWHQGLQVGGNALFKGVGELGYGVARLRYTVSSLKSDQAHSYLVQTFADLGLLGLALTVTLFAAWLLATLRALKPRLGWRELSRETRSEREGLMALAAVVIIFGVQSMLDWTWYFEGVTIPALLCAGWLAGRGPLSQPVGRRIPRARLLDRPGAAAVVTLIAAGALAGAWLMWQPLRSAQDLASAQSAATNSAAFTDARAASTADPLSIQPLLELSVLYQGVHDQTSARAELVKATQSQPENPDTWAWLAQFDFNAGHDQAALREAGQILSLDQSGDSDANEARSIMYHVDQAIIAKAAQRRARAKSRRRHPGGPPAARTSG